jgi:hypothetical protein
MASLRDRNINKPPGPAQGPTRRDKTSPLRAQFQAKTHRSDGLLEGHHSQGEHLDLAPEPGPPPRRDPGRLRARPAWETSPVRTRRAHHPIFAPQPGTGPGDEQDCPG